jgi:hypothetical protein
MVELTRVASAPRSVEEVLSDVTATVKELIPGVDTAGVMLVGKAGKALAAVVVAHDVLIHSAGQQVYIATVVRIALRS